MAKGTFGERLKRERELREVSLEEVSTATRISSRFLQALENEDWSRLPGGVFGRGFVRTIARYLGLSEESLLAEYDLARGENVNPAPPKPEDRIPSPPKWIPVAIVLTMFLLLVGLIVGAVYGWRKIRDHRARKTTTYQSRPLSLKLNNDSSAVLLDLNANSMTPLSAPFSSGRMVLSKV
jgi:cytoskeletal protein RodZ